MISWELTEKDQKDIRDSLKLDNSEVTRTFNPESYEPSSPSHVSYCQRDVDGNLIAFAAVQPVGNFAEITRFYTLARCRRTGLGKEFVLALLHHLKYQGIQEVGADYISEESGRFWYSLGFRPICESSTKLMLSLVDSL
ncbi:TPA: GNAT family N-acetyltransferase [Vibrio diabolicus]